MNLHGDKHNFGQQVKPCERASGTWFQKPRSVFWEYLFFGKESPIKEHFAVRGENGTRPLSDYFFNLEVEIDNPWMGYAKRVDSYVGNGDRLEQFYGFGALIAYAYFFGIQDLHKGNVVRTDTHLQVVDVESVLTHLILPHETLLLPFKSVDFNNSAISHLVSDYREILLGECRSIFSGYFDLCSILLNQLVEIKATLENASIQDHPVRVILRDTSDYRRILESGDYATALLPEEATQLKRGDVPYFFKYVGTSSLGWLKTQDETAVVKENARRLVTPRHAQAADMLLSSYLNLERKMHTGALFLIQKIGPSAHIEVDYQKCTLVISSEGILCSQRKLHIKNGST